MFFIFNGMPNVSNKVKSYLYLFFCKSVIIFAFLVKRWNFSFTFTLKSFSAPGLHFLLLFFTSFLNQHD